MAGLLGTTSLEEITPKKKEEQPQPAATAPGTAQAQTAPPMQPERERLAPPPEVAPATAPPAPPTSRNMSEIERYSNEIRSSLKAAKLKPADMQTFDKELSVIQNEMKAAKRQLHIREAWEAFAHALGKIGAGLYGLKTGTDMSGLQFNKKNWQEEMRLLQDELKLKLEDLRSRRREAISESREARETELGIVKEATRMAAADRRAAAAAKPDKAIAALNKQQEAVKKRIRGNLSKAIQEKDSDQRAALMALVDSDLRSLPGVDPGAVDKALREEGFWFWSDDYEDINPDVTDQTAAAVNQMLQGVPPITAEAFAPGTAIAGGTTAANQTPGARDLVKVKNKQTGEVKVMEASRAAPYLADPRFEKVE